MVISLRVRTYLEATKPVSTPSRAAGGIPAATLHARRRKLVGAAVLCVAGSALLWAKVRNRATVEPAAALDQVAVALPSGDRDQRLAARVVLERALRHSPLGSSGMRRLMAFDETLGHAGACAAAAGGQPGQQTSVAPLEAEVLAPGLGPALSATGSRERAVACRMLAGDYPGAVLAGGDKPDGKTALMVSLARELAVRRRAPGPAAETEPHAR
jgi:hypothetical protein